MLGSDDLEPTEDGPSLFVSNTNSVEQGTALHPALVTEPSPERTLSPVDSADRVRPNSLLF
jgi:hypothetical protein